MIDIIENSKRNHRFHRRNHRHNLWLPYSRSSLLALRKNLLTAETQRTQKIFERLLASSSLSTGILRLRGKKRRSAHTSPGGTAGARGTPPRNDRRQGVCNHQQGSQVGYQNLYAPVVEFRICPIKQSGERNLIPIFQAHYRCFKMAKWISKGLCRGARTIPFS